jgi:hypothetical protein
MNTKEHKEYLREFKQFSKEVTSSKESAKKFLISSGISTPTGRLKRVYIYQASSVEKK